MTDKREQIIARLHQIVAGVSGVATCERNRVAFDDTQLPAVSVLEGDDEVDEDAEKAKRMPSVRPYITVALPQVLIRVATGSLVNSLRSKIIKAILEDADLRGLSLNDGVTFRGMQSTFHAARWSDAGFAALMFGVRFVTDPRDI